MADGRYLAKVVYEAPAAGNDDDNEHQTTIRCNGRLFNINMAASYIHNSPDILARFRRFLVSTREFVYEEDPATDEDEGYSAEEVRNSFHQWLITTFQPVFRDYAPDVLPSFDPDAIRSGTATPRLAEYMFPDVFECRLEAQGGEAKPLCIGKDPEFIPPVNRIPPDLLADLDRLCVPRYSPSEIAVAFENPDEALRQMPNRVLVDVDRSGSGSPGTACHLKLFLGGYEGSLITELRGHLRVLDAQLSAEIRVIRLVGIVWLEEYADASDRDKNGKPVPYPESLLGPVGGLLLTYVSEGWDGLLSTRAWGSPPDMRQQWADQVRETVASLHKAGIIWGDAKPDNVMVDGNNNAWLIDLGGGYTEGWVDKEKAGTKEGDLQGVAKIEEYLLDDDKLEMTSEDEDEQDDRHEEEFRGLCRDHGDIKDKNEHDGESRDLGRDEGTMSKRRKI